MSEEFEVGDKVQGYHSKRDLEVLAVYGDSVWVISSLAGARPYTEEKSLLVKVEPKWEVGKVYTSKSGEGFERYKVAHIFDNGSVVIVWGENSYTRLAPANRKYYKEVK